MKRIRLAENAAANLSAWIVGLAALIGAPRAHAQLAIDWYTVDGGGGVSVGGSLSLEGTAGQFDAGFGLSGGTMCATTAYWEGGRYTENCPGDLNGDNYVNTNDLVLFLAAFGTPNACGGGPDLNFDGLINTQDLVAFLGNFGQYCNPVVTASAP